MVDKESIETLLKKLVHPETSLDIVSSGVVQEVKTSADKISFTLSFDRARDPFSGSIKKQAEKLITSNYPEYTGKISILIKEGAPVKRETPKTVSRTGGIRNIIAIVSGKGGVGKSTVTSNLAVQLTKEGYKVGVLDADIYGPSQPKMFGLEGYLPDARKEDGGEWIVPAESQGVKIMSIGFFISPDDALVWRGPMATSALRQIIHQTDWGVLDFLLIDMPPGTGDIHLTILQELKVTGAIVATTPQQVAIADAVRAVKMLRSKELEVPILGVLENMAWFTPAELPDNRYYLFGKGGGVELAKKENVELLGQVPVVQSVMDGGEAGIPAVLTNSLIAQYYEHVVKSIVKKL